MRQRSLFKALVMGLMLVGLARPSESRADQTPVHAGYDLFHTLEEGTVFDFGDPFGSQNLMGVPLGSFDFGAPIGSQGTGNTDTIVQRLDDVTTDGGTTRLLMRALQLESVNAVDALGNHLFVTLNAQNPSDGSMQIFDNNTFSSTLAVHFDVLLGTSLSTATLIPGMENLVTTLSNEGTPWSHTPPPGVTLINGVNYLLDGSTIGQDFWPDPIHNGPHLVVPGTPEPSTWIMGVTAIAIGLAYGRRRARRA